MQLHTWLLRGENRPAHIGQVAADHTAQHRQVVETEPEIGLNGWVLLAHPLYISLLISSLYRTLLLVKNGEPERCIFNEIPTPSRQAEIWYDLGELPTISTNMMSADWKHGDRKGSPLLYFGGFSRSCMVGAYLSALAVAQ